MVNKRQYKKLIVLAEEYLYSVQAIKMSYADKYDASRFIYLDDRRRNTHTKLLEAFGLSREDFQNEDSLQSVWYQSVQTDSAKELVDNILVWIDERNAK